MLCLLLFLLILPLLCIPCIFVWLMRQGFLFAEPPSRGCDPGVLDKMEVVKFNETLFDDNPYPSECCICMGDFDDSGACMRRGNDEW